eukprot:m.441182 g.441182  ORF g.441182 m.441182 type:complete len:508 (+) comp21467_c0_seq6:1-1524(+)
MWYCPICSDQRRRTWVSQRSGCATPTPTSTVSSLIPTQVSTPTTGHEGDAREHSHGVLAIPTAAPTRRRGSTPVSANATSSVIAHGDIASRPRGENPQTSARTQSRAKGKTRLATGKKQRQVVQLPATCMDCLKLGKNKRVCPQCRRIMAVRTLQEKDRRIRMFKQRQRQCAESLLLDADERPHVHRPKKQAALGSAFSLDRALEAMHSLSRHPRWRRTDATTCSSSTPLLDAARAASGLPVRSNSTPHPTRGTNVSSLTTTSVATCSTTVKHQSSGSNQSVPTREERYGASTETPQSQPSDGASSSFNVLEACRSTSARAKRKRSDSPNPQTSCQAFQMGLPTPRIRTLVPALPPVPSPFAVPATVPPVSSTVPSVVPPTEALAGRGAGNNDTSSTLSARAKKARHVVDSHALKSQAVSLVKAVLDVEYKRKKIPDKTTFKALCRHASHILLTDKPFPWSATDVAVGGILRTNKRSLWCGSLCLHNVCLQVHRGCRERLNSRLDVP